MQNSKYKVVGVIPARFESSRFPGKMLVEIMGKSLIRRTYEQAIQARQLKEVIVATDNEKIRDHVLSFGGKAVMTSSTCPTGTDRVSEAVEKTIPDADHVVNIQGDEPLINPTTIDRLVEQHVEKESLMTTAATPLSNPESFNNPGVVKCVFDGHFKALYFSRSLIPYPRKNKEYAPFFRHIGIYCFRREFLTQYTKLPVTPLCEIEDLEQLKVLEAGFPISVVVVDEKGIEVNYPEDIAKVEEFLCRENTSLSQAALSPR